MTGGGHGAFAHREDSNSQHPPALAQPIHPHHPTTGGTMCHRRRRPPTVLTMRALDPSQAFRLCERSPHLARRWKASDIIFFESALRTPQVAIVYGVAAGSSDIALRSAHVRGGLRAE